VSAPRADLGIRRMLLALEASAHELAGVEAAAALAARANAELFGLLVEDEALCRLAELSMARVHGRFAPAGHSIDVAGMNRSLRVFSTRLRERIAKSAEQAGVRWSFEVVRGRMPAEIARAASNADLVLLGGGEGAFSIASSSASCVLVRGAAFRLDAPRLVVVSGSRASEKALVTAAELALPGSAPWLGVLVAPGSLVDMATWRENAAMVLGRLGRRAQFKMLGSLDATELSAMAVQRGATLILDSEVLPVEELGALLERATFPILLVR